MDVGRIIVDRDIVRIGDRTGAGEHATLVDAYAGDALFRQTFGQETVGCALDAEGVVAVAIRRA